MVIHNAAIIRALADGMGNWSRDRPRQQDLKAGKSNCLLVVGEIVVNERKCVS